MITAVKFLVGGGGGGAMMQITLARGLLPFPRSVYLKEKKNPLYISYPQQTGAGITIRNGRFLDNPRLDWGVYWRLNAKGKQAQAAKRLLEVRDVTLAYGTFGSLAKRCLGV